MLRFVEVEGYRCFPKFRMDGLARVNLLVGKNNCGKTCLLEAVQLLASGGSLDVLAKIAEGRGEVAVNGTELKGPIEPRPLVIHFFHDRAFDIHASFHIRGDMDFGDLAVCVQEVKVSRQKQLWEEPEASGRFESRHAVLAVVVEERTRGRVTVYPKSRVSETGTLLDSGQMIFAFGDSPTTPEVPPLQFITADSLQPRLMNDMWNQVLLEGREAEVIEAMRILEPEIDNIVFLSGDAVHRFGRGGVLVAFSDSDRRVPLGSLGDGMRRLLALALSLVRAKGGILLIDEIDTGLHYSVMGDMWRLIIQGARQADIQVFAATHSYDCVRGLAWACEHDPELAHDVSLQKIHGDLEESVALDAKGIILAVEREVETR
jgi:hypothetical protein